MQERILKSVHERISTRDGSYIASFGNHIQRYDFALPYCVGKTVLDAGCGIGYGSYHLAMKGASQVYGVDLSVEAIKEAALTFHRHNLVYAEGDLQRLDEMTNIPEEFDVVVNFENLEHLPDPKAFLERVRLRLSENNGVFITSTPNGDISDMDANGKLKNIYHVHEFTPAEFSDLLGSYFKDIKLYCQWQTYDGVLRQMISKDIHAQLCEAYFNPMARIGRFIKGAFGKKVAGPPIYTAAGDSFSWDYRITEYADKPVPWPPTVLLAVCSL